MSAEDRDSQRRSPNSENRVKLTVPQTIEVQRKFIEGPFTDDTDKLDEIRFELMPDELTGSQNDYWREIARRGARIFITESDNELIIHSEESLAFKNSIRKTET